MDECRLEEWRRRLQQELAASTEDSLFTERRLRGLHDHLETDWLDLAQEVVPEQVLRSITERQRERFREIEEAIERIEAGAYGECEDCARLIHPARLDLIPWARCCTACQEKRDLWDLGPAHDRDYVWPSNREMQWPGEPGQ